MSNWYLSRSSRTCFTVTGFRLSAFGLKIDDFRHAVAEKDRVAAPTGPPGETGTLQNEAQIVEVEVRIGATLQDFADGFLDAAHGMKPCVFPK